MMFIDEALEVTDEQFSKLVPQLTTRGVFAMTIERCQYCGRTLKQHTDWSIEIEPSLGCKRCADGYWNWRIAHAKAVRLAWKYRAITRRRCDGCKHYPCVADLYSVMDEAQCPQWEAK